MSVVVVGLHERDAPLELLERLAVGDGDVAKALASLCDSPHLSEAVVLSTCMRTEVYAVLERFHDGLADINAFFHARAGTSPAGERALEDRLVVAYDDAAARHLFEVAAGSDSAVLGEGEILRQVRQASERARAERASGPVLGGLFRHAIEVGKRARSETAIARGITSLAHVAVALATEASRPRPDGLHALVLGAGEMGTGIASGLAGSEGVAEIVVVSRSSGRAAALALSVGGRQCELDSLLDELARADVLLSATSSPETILDESQLREVMAQRPDRPLLVVDAAVPRDVDPGAGAVPGVRLLDLQDLRAYADAEMQARRAEVDSVHAIVEEELERYRTSVFGRSVAPVVASLRQRAEQLRAAELERIRPRLDQLGPAERDAVEAFSKRLVAKLLHDPTVQVKQAAGSARGERLAEALRQLFDLSAQES